MINDIKVYNYKSLQEAYLKDLAHTNIICGKNSSGKSTILEALLHKDCYSLGKKASVDQFKRASESQLNSYSSPDGKRSWTSLSIFFKEYCEKNPVLFSSDSYEIQEDIQEFNKTDSYLRAWSNAYSYATILRNFFSELPDYKPALIPPKRIFETLAAISGDVELNPDGRGCINRLFYLKNQHIKTNDFRLYNEVLNTFKEITTYYFNIVINKNNQLQLVFKIGEEWQEAESCGLGLRDVLTIVTFVLCTDYNVYLIEEPENHLHANLQKRLLKFINSVKDKQFIISTHSNVFLDTSDVNKIYHCWFDETIKVSDKTSLSHIINSLGGGIGESISSDAIILTEGPKDIPIIKALLKWCGISDKYHVKLWPLGGDIMGELDLSVFSDRKNVFAIVDSDPGSHTMRTKFAKNCKDHNIRFFKLERYAIENYLSVNALKNIFPDQISSQIKELNNDTSVDVQLGFDKKKRTIKGRNYDTIKLMHLDDFKNTDLLKYILEIQKKLEQ